MVADELLGVTPVGGVVELAAGVAAGVGPSAKTGMALANVQTSAASTAMKIEFDLATLPTMTSNLCCNKGRLCILFGRR